VFCKFFYNLTQFFLFSCFIYLEIQKCELEAGKMICAVCYPTIPNNFQKRNIRFGSWEGICKMLEERYKFNSTDTVQGLMVHLADEAKTALQKQKTQEMILKIQKYWQDEVTQSDKRFRIRNSVLDQCKELLKELTS